jgi:hypothetical protein
MIIPFVGRAELDARQNLSAYIEHARSYRFFHGPNAVNWDQNSWDLRPFFTKASSTSVGLAAHFTNLETTRRGSRSKTAIDLQEPFLSAAKALLTDFLRTSGENSATRIVGALRTIEMAFRDLGQHPDICHLTAPVLDRAQEIIVEKYKDAWSYGRLLERIVLDYINQSRISENQIHWRTSIQYRAPTRNDRVNQEGARGNSAKLPNLQAIFDLASVFHDSSYVPDVVASSWFALAMFAPSRVTEVLGLPTDCETEMDGRYGLSWRPLKGGDAMTKFAASEENAEIAKLAIRKLLAIGEKPRIAHKWYEENPGRLYLPPGFEHLRGEPITQWEAAQIIGRTKPITPGQAVYNAFERCGTTTDLSRGQPGRQGGVFRVLVTFESLEKYVIGALPPTFPYIDPRNRLPGSRALFCMPDEVMRGAAEPQQYIPRYLTYAQITHELGSKPTGKTIFSRNNLINPETGEPWRLNTHQPRHLLNTLAQSKYMSQELIAFWSGRKSVQQNASYNHVSQEAYIEAFVFLDEAAPTNLKVVGPLADKIDERARKESITRETALKLEVGSTITTRFGLCRHDYSLMPCPKDKDCIRCGENTFIKGSSKHVEEARLQLSISKKAVEQARAALDAGRYGAQRWVTIHEEKANRWQLALDHLTDPQIDDGTLITLPAVLNPQTRSGLAAAVREAEFRPDEVDGSSDQLLATFDQLWSDEGEL